MKCYCDYYRNAEIFELTFQYLVISTDNIKSIYKLKLKFLF